MKSNRRQFLGAAAGTVMAAPATFQPGFIGCGGYGMTDLRAAFQAGGAGRPALCDVDCAHLERAAAEVEKAQGRRPALYQDYRELAGSKGLDAVIIATPPQWRALPFVEACRRGPAIYEEKPLACDIGEGRAMIAAAKQADGIVQAGFQRRQSECFPAAREYIRSGCAGRTVQVDAQIHYQAAPDPTPKAPPAALDWDAWCGPAPKLPYSEAVAHRSWRLEEAYGNGRLVDRGIHLVDALTALGGLYEYKGKITTPGALTAHFEFAGCTVVRRHRLWGAAGNAPDVNNGVFCYGDKETVFVSDSRWASIPRGKGGERRVFEGKSNARFAHMRDPLNAVRAPAASKLLRRPDRAPYRRPGED